MQTDKSARLKIQRALRLDFALRLVWQSAPGWTIASLALLIVQGALPLVSLYLMKLTVDAVTAALEAPDKGAAFGRVALLIGVTGGVALVSALARSIAGLVSEAQGQVVTDQMSDILHAKSIEVDLEYYESAQYYDKLTAPNEKLPSGPSAS